MALHTTAASLSLVTRIPAAIYEDAIPALKKLGWLEEVGDLPQTLAQAVEARRL
jgi:hypothetical protein